MTRESPTGILKACLDLCRVSNLPTVWTNVLAALLLSGAELSFMIFSVLALSLSLFYTGGMCLNDVCDLSVDRIKRPSRPLPSGRLTLRGACALTAGLFSAGLGLLLLSPHHEAIPAGLVLLGLIVIYDIFHKAHPSAVLLMAGCRFSVFAVCALAVTGSLSPSVIVGGALQFFYTLVISVVARHENERASGFSIPVVPLMIAGISLVDGLVMAFFVSPAWLAAGVTGALLTLLGQRYVRGD